MKFSFYHVAQRFSIRKYSFGAASVLLGVFLLSGVQTAHADEQAAASESTTSITSDNGVVSDKVTSSNAEIVLSEATVSVPKESLVPAEVLSSAVTPEKTSESSQQVETSVVQAKEKIEGNLNKVENSVKAKKGKLDKFISKVKGKSWKLVWDDEFNGDRLDSTKWAYWENGNPWNAGNYVDENGKLVNQYGFDAKQYYLRDNVKVENGNMVITLKKENDKNYIYIWYKPNEEYAYLAKKEETIFPVKEYLHDDRNLIIAFLATIILNRGLHRYLFKRWWTLPRK